MKNDSLDTPGKRLKWARERKGFATASEFGKRVGIEAVTYRAYENDQNGYAQFAFLFAEKLGVGADWLLQGGIEPDAAPSVSSGDETVSTLGLVMIPQLEIGYSMGGGSVFNDYRHVGLVPFHREMLRFIMRGSFNDLFAASAVGDSMQPTLLDGDIVLIDTAQKDITHQDRIWALSYGELGMIKRVRRLPGGTYRLMSDNGTVSDIDAADGEMYVVGRVIWIGRRI
jgi:phage repressor protein C with HTH and peptisase S24 domain